VAYRLSDEPSSADATPPPRDQKLARAIYNYRLPNERFSCPMTTPPWDQRPLHWHHRGVGHEQGSPGEQRSGESWPSHPEQRIPKDWKNRKVFYCLHEDCADEDGRHTRSFSRQADVRRHMASVHTKPHLDCPKPRCNRRGENGFLRQDHLTEHLRQYHREDIPKGRKRRAGQSDATHQPFMI